MWQLIAEAKAGLFMDNGAQKPRETDLADAANPMAGKGRPPEQKTEEQIALERAEDASRRTRGL
jgi:hypothetical protein